MYDFASKVRSAVGTYIYSTGQAGYIIRSRGGQLLGIDLYLSDCVERLEGHMGYKRLLPQILGAGDLVFNAVICTHPHGDHFDIDSIATLLESGSTKLLCSVDCERLVRELGLEALAVATDDNEPRIRYIKPMDSVDIGDFHIDFVNCDHGEGAPDAVGVVVEVDGKRIYEAGDTCLRLDRIDEIRRPIDALIAPINGAYGNLDEEDCSRLAERLEPKVTIPCHYGMFASHHGDVGKFYDIMMEKKLSVHIMCQGEGYEL